MCGLCFCKKISSKNLGCLFLSSGRVLSFRDTILFSINQHHCHYVEYLLHRRSNTAYRMVIIALASLCCCYQMHSIIIMGYRSVFRTMVTFLVILTTVSCWVILPVITNSKLHFPEIKATRKDRQFVQLVDKAKIRALSENQPFGSMPRLSSSLE